MPRKKILTPEIRAFFAAHGKKGGQTRAKNLSPEQRSAIASRAARAYWEKKRS